MEFVQLTASQQDNFVHDISFDFYGKRFATCATDGKIKVWDYDEDDSSWSSTEIPEAHGGSICWRLSWAHPEFGNLIASCSEDRSVAVWEEQIAITKSRNDNRERWMKKVQLTDSKKAVNDVKFSPRHLGLKLAAGSSDGFVRIYEATDVFSLNYWQLTHTFQVENTTISDVTQQSGNPLRQSEHGITCLAWNECVFEPAKIAVGGYSRKAVVWTFDASQEGPSKWREECELDSDPKGSVDAIGGAGHAGVGGSGRVINDIAWAPSMGRSYHLIATASRENCFRIHTLQRHADGSLVPSHTHCEEVSSPVWRVAWNATGTVLATSSEDGSLTYWRRDFAGSWKNVQSLPSGNESSASTVFHPNLA